MLEGFRHLFGPRSLREIAVDIVDILIVGYLIYRVLLVIRGTRAMQMVMGLGLLLAIYFLGRFMGMVTTVSMLSSLASSIILVVVVVFQADLRRGLMKAGGRPLFMGLARDDEAKVIDEVVAAVAEMAKLHMGAIITWEREANLDEFVTNSGTPLDAQVTRELLVTIFNPVAENKLHDGAVIIRNLRIAKAGVFFPMPDKQGLDKQFGSRHRAAIGITADTDAIAIVVSEERGTIMFCFQENHVDAITPDVLRNLLRRYETKSKKPKKPVTVPGARRSLPPPETSRAGAALASSATQRNPVALGRGPATITSPSSISRPRIDEPDGPRSNRDSAMPAGHEAPSESLLLREEGPDQ